MEQISALQLQQWLSDESRGRPVLLDVREPWEFELCRIEGSLSLPLATVPMRAGELDSERDIVVICHHGGRSFQAAMFLERQGFTRLHNLVGGVDGWARHVDPAMPTY